MLIDTVLKYDMMQRKPHADFMTNQAGVEGFIVNNRFLRCMRKERRNGAFSIYVQNVYGKTSLRASGP